MKKSMLMILLLSVMLFIAACSSPNEEPATQSDQEEVAVDEVVSQDIEEEDTEVEENTEEEDEATNAIGDRLSTAYVDIMSSDSYMMRYLTYMDIEGIETEATVTMVVSQEKSAFRTETGEFNSTTIIEEDTFSIVDHNGKTVMAMPSSVDVTDNEELQPMDIGYSNLEFVGTGTGTFMGNNRNYEEYAVDDTKILYYFDGDRLDGMEMKSANDQTVVMVVEEMTNNIDESIFEIPEDYQTIKIGN